MVRLPPKVFALLRLLVARAGQLVTKEVLLETVWPETVVSEAVLTSCIGELRKALAETAHAPRFIQTVHRRGYRFIGHLPPVAPSTPPPSPRPRAAAPPPLLVGRERELTHLHQWLERVRQGARQTVFLTGEPGLGKTTVVNAFVEDVAAAGDVWLARGQCIEHYGGGEAYLPVLEALGRLCREPEGAALLPVLEQQAPTWLAQMPALLSATALGAVQRRVVGATQQRMLRELAEAVEVLTVSRPLLLVLEDLHWGDYATLDLLTYLARRLGPVPAAHSEHLSARRGAPARASLADGQAGIGAARPGGGTAPRVAHGRGSRAVSGAPVRRWGGPPAPDPNPGADHVPAHGRSSALHGDDCRASAPLWSAPGGCRAVGGAARGRSRGPGGAAERARDDRAAIRAPQPGGATGAGSGERGGEQVAPWPPWPPGWTSRWRRWRTAVPVWCSGASFWWPAGRRPGPMGR